MWVFKQNTIAGDLGVTPIIQCLASMLITSTLVHTDLHHHAIQPLPFCYPHVEHLPDPRLLFEKKENLKRRTSSSTLNGTPATAIADPEKPVVPDAWAGREGTFAYYYWMLVRFIFEGTEKNMLLAKVGFANWFGRAVWTAAQGAAIGIVFGFPLWCLAIVILGPIYGTGNMGGKWAPQAIKCVYGAVVGWVTNPVIAVLALGSQAEHHLLVVEHDDVEQTAVAASTAMEVPEGQEMLDSIPTIREGEELEPPTMRSRAASSTPSRRSMRPPPSPTISMGRMRAHSNASVVSATPSFSGRPPLTANVSYLTALPSTPLPSDATVPTRPRGATVSSSSASVRSFSYMLGGTGGRAQRSRSNTTQSATIPKFAITTPGDEEPPSAPAGSSGTWDAFGRNETPASPGLGVARGSPSRSRASSSGRSPRITRRTSLAKDGEHAKDE